MSNRRDQPDRDFEALEREVGDRLRALPEVEPDPAFREELRRRLAAESGSGGKGGPTGPRRRSLFYRLTALAAACLVVLAAGWLALFAPGEEQTPGTGPLFLVQAQAGAGSAGGASLNLACLDTLRRVEFTVRDGLPAVPEEAPVWRLKHTEPTREEILELAARLGMENPQPAGEAWETVGGGPPAVIGDGDTRLLVWPRTGAWLYEYRPSVGDETAPPPAAADAEISPDEVRAVALDWLERAGLLPAAEDCRVEQRENEVTVRLAATPNGRPVTGSELSYRVMVASDGTVTDATGIWYPTDRPLTAGLIDYAAALDRLREGEGLFEARNYHPETPGTAVVDSADLAYRLAYALDFTPYLVPVAVFRGEYIPEGGEPGEFTAYVSLLAHPEVPNAGNFVLDTALPEAPAAARGLRERPLAATEAELPVLARYFGLDTVPGTDGTFRGPQGEELSPTSWDGGWIYRGPDESTRDRENARVNVDELLAAAQALADELPALAGEPGAPAPLFDYLGDWNGARLPLLYDGLPVVKPDPDQRNADPFVSDLWVWQLGTDREVWTVKCSHPMEFTGERIPLITAEQAWEQLLANQSAVYVEGFFGVLPGDRFAAAESRVTEAGLAYVPRHPEMVRNKHYDVMYLFTGEALVGDRWIEFTAAVPAAKPAS